jgi:hypothetical protein
MWRLHNRCLFRWGETGCRHLNNRTASQKTLWSTVEKANESKENEGGDLDRKEASMKDPFPSGQGCRGKLCGGKKTPLSLQHTILRQTATEKTQQY